MGGSEVKDRTRCLRGSPWTRAACGGTLPATSPTGSEWMDPTLITTAFELPGYRVSHTLGVVRGITVRSRNVFGTIGANLQKLRGGNITLLTELCEQSRAESFGIMIRHA